MQSTEEPSYSQAIDEVHMIGDYFVNLNCMHLKSANQELYKQLITYPREIIPIFDIAINEIYTERYPNDNLSQPIQVIILVSVLNIRYFMKLTIILFWLIFR